MNLAPRSLEPIVNSAFGGFASVADVGKNDLHHTRRPRIAQRASDVGLVLFLFTCYRGTHGSEYIGRFRRVVSHIYCLYDTEEFRPRYVGQSRQDGRRLVQHYGCAADGDPKEIYRWMRSALLRGFEVDAHVLEDHVPSPVLDSEERLWMSRYPDLTNRNGYERDAALTAFEAQATRRIRTSAPAVTYNTDGRIGVCHDRRVDAFFVRLTFGRVDGRCWSAYVEGDTLADDPCGNAWWFPDVRSALAARDAERKRIACEPLFRAYVGENWRWPRDVG